MGTIGDKPTVRLNDWFVCGNYLCGKVFQHPRLPPGSYVQTSAIVAMDEANLRCETSNTLYVLHNKLKVHRE